jgi:hypothetical protein
MQHSPKPSMHGHGELRNYQRGNGHGQPMRFTPLLQCSGCSMLRFWVIRPKCMIHCIATPALKPGARHIYAVSAFRTIPRGKLKSHLVRFALFDPLISPSSLFLAFPFPLCPAIPPPPASPPPTGLFFRWPHAQSGMKPRASFLSCGSIWRAAPHLFMQCRRAWI